MAKIRNVSGEDRIVPGLGGRLVLDGAVVDVPDDDTYSYTVQALWAPVDKAAEKAHAAGRKAEAARGGHVPDDEPKESAPEPQEG